MAIEKKPTKDRSMIGDKSRQAGRPAIPLAVPFLETAARLRRSGHMAESLAPQQQAVRIDPGNAAAQHDLGLTYLHCDRVDEAIACFRSAIALDENFGHAYYRLGIALELQGLDGEAYEAYRRAVGLFGTPADAKTRLADLLVRHGRRREAIDAFKSAAAAAPDSTVGRLNLIKALIVEERDADAEAALRRLLASDGNSSTAHWMLGTICAESGRFPEAAAAFERSITLGPQQGVAYYDLVRVRAVTDADLGLIDRMLAVAQTLHRGDQRVLLQLALGKAFEDLRRYGEAMRHFVAANQIKKTFAPFDRALLRRRIDRIVNLFTADLIDACRGGGNDSERPIFIIGMPRSGTTLVEQILSSHREVEGAGELVFWGQRGRAFEQACDVAAIERLQRRATADYLHLLGELAPAGSRVTDKMPFNFLWTGLIHLAFPRATFIHCRRNPIDTCLSIHSTYFAPRPDFSTDRDDLVFYYNQYLRLMAHWRTVLPAERFIEVDYEAVVAEPEALARRLIAGCGLDWDPACLAPERNERRVKTASKWQARQPIYSTAVQRWRRYEPWIGSFGSLRAHS